MDPMLLPHGAQGLVDIGGPAVQPRQEALLLILDVQRQRALEVAFHGRARFDDLRVAATRGAGLG